MGSFLHKFSFMSFDFLTGKFGSGQVRSLLFKLLLSINALTATKRGILKISNTTLPDRLISSVLCIMAKMSCSVYLLLLMDRQVADGSQFNWPSNSSDLQMTDARYSYAALDGVVYS